MSDRGESWAERTVEVPPEEPTVHEPAWPPFVPPFAAAPEYHRGVARVGTRGGPSPEATQEYAGQPSRWDDTDPGSGPVRPAVRHQVRQLRRGGEWTWLGGLFAFVCWGIWTVSVRGDDFLVPGLAFLLVLLVAVGVFTLSRVLGRVIIERGLGRVRRSAWAAHLATGLFLAAAGVAYLGQTEWVIAAWNWLRGLG